MLRSTYLALLMFAGIASADVQNGIVRYQGQTIPGATVTAECGKDTDKITTVTDDAGRFAMGGLPSTSCKFTILLFGFEPLQKDATASATPLTFDLTMQKVASIPVAPGVAPTVTAVNPVPAAGAPAAPTPAPSQASAPNLGQMPSLTSGNGRGGQNGGRGQANARGAQNGRGGGFQSLSLTQNADSTASDAPASLLGGDNGGTGAGASDAFTVNGTLSQGIQAQAGDGMGMGGPGGFGFGAGGPGGDFGGPGGGGFGGPGGGGRGDGGGDRGSRGGGGQGFAGGPGGGGPGGGFGGPGGGGGFGGGGRGGGQGGPGGRGGRSPNGVSSFGNRAGRGRGPQWQASVTYNFANSALNARPYSFASQTTVPVKAATANNQMGFTLGGPIMIPHTKLNLKNSRWNLNVTGARNRVGVDDISSVPSAAMRNGDFSSLLGTLTLVDPNPASSAPITGNIIPQSRINPTALALLNSNYIPLPTGSGLRNNYQLIANNPSNTNNVNLQISDPITTKDRININMSRQGRSSDQVQSFGYRDPTNGWGGNLSLSYSRTLDPTTVNTLSLTGNRNVTNNCSFFQTPGINPAFCNVLSSEEAPTLSFQNFTGLNDSTPSTNHSTQAGLTDSIAKTKGKHNMQIGVTATKRYTNSLTASNARGTYSFSSVNAGGTGYDFADFLLGLPNGASANQYLNGDDNFYYRQYNMAAYANDDYRLTTNLTLNGGLRWEFYTPQTEKYNHMANVTFAQDGLSAALITPGEMDPNTGQRTPDGLIKGDYKMYEPQIGFAYKPWATKAIVFRGGYDIRYNGSAYQTQASKLAIQPPFVNTVNVTSTTTPGLTLQNGLNAAPSGTISNTYALAPNYQPARAQQWNAIAQYTFARSYVFQMSYFGTKGDHLDVLLGPNRNTPIPGQKIGSPGPISNMGSTIQLDESIGNSIFHSGSAQLTRRFARGLSGSATYTLQKSIDDSSTLGGGVVQIENNILAERALSPGIPHQTLGINFNYQTLAGNQKSEFYWNIIRGWQLFGGYNLTSGSPFTATISGDVSGTGIIGSARAEATGLPVTDGVGYFNPAAFTVPANGTYGDAGRDTIPGIWNFTMNGSAMRSFRIGERRRLALTFSTQNPLNHPTITGINTVIGSQTLLPGTPTSAGGMRTVSAQARFTF